MTDLSIKELWELQERLWDDPRLEDALNVARSFPKPKSRPMTDEEHLVIIIWGMEVESVVSDKLNKMGCENHFINEDDHKFLKPIPLERKRDADIVVPKSEYVKSVLRGSEADIKGWDEFGKYAHPRWTSPHPTIDLVLRPNKTASIYITGKRDSWLDPAGATFRAKHALHFEFEPDDERIFDYKKRMLDSLKEKRAL